MKKITAFIVGAALTFSSCDFLSEYPTTSLPNDIALKTANDIANALNGTYNRLGSAGFLGRNIHAIGDISSDIVSHSIATNHFLNIYNYTIQPTNIYLEEVWEYGYKVINSSALIINQSPKARENATESEKIKIDQCVAQAYGLRALTTFYLTNIFGLPYNTTNASTLGIVNVERPIAAFQKITRNTVEENYTLILSDIEQAIAQYKKEGVMNVSTFHMNLGAVLALKSRVLLYKGDFDGAITAAQEAIATTGTAIATTTDEYKKSFTTLTSGSEDIFQIAKRDDDYLSANSLNTLYTNYGVSINPVIISQIAPSDIRRSIIGDTWTGGKVQGTSSGTAVSNLPVLRLPELYLNIAEAYARKATPDYVQAKVNLLEVAAKRNAAFDPNTINADPSILDVIKKERMLELLQEGHRFFDTRRWGETINVSGGSKKNFNIAKFVYPIPAYEINSGFGVTQTPNWSGNLPK